MGLKYTIKELFVGKFPNPQNLYNQLVDLDNQIKDGADPVVPIKKNVKLNKTGLKKAFGDPSKFDTIAIVKNAEGCYLVVSDKEKYKFVSLEDL